MNEHGLSGMCAYIEDFTVWYVKAKFPPDSTKFVQDRFSECSKEKKQELSEIFNKLITKISDDGKWNSEIDDVAEELVKILS